MLELYSRNLGLNLLWESCYFAPSPRSEEDANLNKAVCDNNEMVAQLDPSLFVITVTCLEPADRADIGELLQKITVNTQDVEKHTIQANQQADWLMAKHQEKCMPLKIEF